MPSSACRVEKGQPPTSKRSVTSPATTSVLQKTSDLTFKDAKSKLPIESLCKRIAYSSPAGSPLMAE